MNDIVIIRSQEELDAIIKGQEELDAVSPEVSKFIEIYGLPEQEFTLSQLLHSEVHAHGSLRIRLKGRARIYVHNECRVWAEDESYVCASDKCIIECHDRSRSMVSGEATANMYDCSQVYGVEKATIYAYDHSRAVSYSACSIFAHNHSNVNVRDFIGVVVARGMSRVAATNARRVELREHSVGHVEKCHEVHCYDRAIARSTESFVVLNDHSRGVFCGGGRSLCRDEATWTIAKKK